jgi:hypothetical protein
MHSASCKKQQHSQQAGYGEAEAPRFFNPASLTVCIFSLSLFFLFAHLDFRVRFCIYEGTVPYRSSAQMSCREDAGVSFVALGILEVQTARH